MNKIPSEEEIKSIGNLLANPNRPLKERFRALFTLKNIGGEYAIKQISSCFLDPSALLKHEMAYCLGQIRDVRAIPYLISILEDFHEESIVRHEAGEALGAIGDSSVIDCLKLYTHNTITEIAETCQLALDRIAWLSRTNSRNDPSSDIFLSIDPAPPSEEKDIIKLKLSLLNENLCLFERYRAMFALRNLNSTESAKVLACGFSDSSVLFRHEIAYVLGQMASEIVLSDLATVIRNKEENSMVRHEAVEALGAIATDDAIAILKNFINDDERLVRESCEIALDMCAYENSDEFQYADGLYKIKFG